MIAFSRLAAPLYLALLLGAACSSPDQPRSQSAPDGPAAAAPAPAATSDTAQARFSWDGELCHNTGYYPASRYTERQLRDSHALVFGPSAVWVPWMQRPDEVQADTLARRIGRLDAQYQRTRAQVQALQVVDVPYWRRLHQQRLRSLAEDYRLQRLMLRAYLEPELLAAESAPGCRAYAQALASPDTAVLFRAWRQLVRQQKAANGDPQRLEADFQQRYHSPDATRYARLDLLGYGWWNCVIAAKKDGGVVDNGQPEAEFKRLFTRVVADNCADPD